MIFNGTSPADVFFSMDSTHFSDSGLLGKIVGFLMTLASSSYIKFMITGTMMEGGRTAYYWALQRVRLRPSMSAHFCAGDPAYEAVANAFSRKDPSLVIFELSIIELLRWKGDSGKTSATLMLQHALRSASGLYRLMRCSIRHENDDKVISTDYIPKWREPHFLKWRGYWMDVYMSSGSSSSTKYSGYSSGPDLLHVIFLTSDTSVLPAFIQEVRDHYMKTHKQAASVIIHLPSNQSDFRMGGGYGWSVSKEKPLRPLNTVTLEEGVLEDLIKDVSDFLKLEEWYIMQGIPHRRGYLLHGPPGTGKTSTIYALAGELGLEIYSCSLSGMSDDYLQKLAGSIPRNSIFMIEDIDCAFPSREEQDDNESPTTARGPEFGFNYMPMGKTSVTMSGLLNVLDGVGSDEGRIFFATTNYPSRLDAALVRPGRIDRQIAYKKASATQLKASWDHFFPPGLYKPATVSELPAATCAPSVSVVGYFHSPAHPPVPLGASLSELSEKFLSAIPFTTFSTAELQGYLLLYKFDPERAANNIENWVHEQLGERKLREEEEERKREVKERKKKEAVQQNLQWEKEWIDGIGDKKWTKGQQDDSQKDTKERWEKQGDKRWQIYQTGIGGQAAQKDPKDEFGTVLGWLTKYI